MDKHKPIRLAFYGDDLTGSTDALEFISRAGANALLFIGIPDASRMIEFPEMDVIGIAGMTRSLPSDDMEAVLIPAFRFMKEIGARHIHYKVCSTFDSSPQVGSIGKAIDCGQATIGSHIVPVLGGMPSLGRYCIFGNLFARMGIGSRGGMYRLDRHPSMRHHPVTPADEADLRLLLARQTRKNIALIDLLQMQLDIDRWKDVLNADDEIVLMDAFSENDLTKIGDWLDACVVEGQPLFCVGSSGIEKALGDHWNRSGAMTPTTGWSTPSSVSPLLVLSGSCSPVTAAQIEWAKGHGFKEMIIDAQGICNGDDRSFEALKEMLDLLNDEQDLIIHTGDRLTAKLPSEIIGGYLGRLAKEAVRQTSIKRVVLSGGDTSSHAAISMGIDALRMLAPLVVGAPLCQGYSKDAEVDGLEMNMKGGQLGPANYFGILRDGHITA